MSSLHCPLAEPIFRVAHRVIYGDTDAAGVVYNANYLRYFEIGRTELMRAWVISYRAIEEMGYVLPVSESYLRFKAPAHYDDLITIATSLVALGKVSCRFHYHIFRAEQEGREALLARGFTVHACVNQKGKLSPFPPSLVEQMLPHLQKETKEQSNT